MGAKTSKHSARYRAFLSLVKVAVGAAGLLVLGIALVISLTPHLAPQPVTGRLQQPAFAIMKTPPITTYLPLIAGGFSGDSSAEPVSTLAVLAAFPGAEGFGANSQGGRGGRVYVVSTLQDYDPTLNEAVIPGSLRECIDGVKNPVNDPRRTCVFSVAGYITLKSQLKVQKPYLTIAGQTAPGNGITLRINAANPWGPMKIMTHDVILRYLRLRPGLHPNQAKQGAEANYNIDALTIGEVDSTEPGSPPYNPYNIIVDHVSLSWSADELLNTWYTNDDVTIQWSIMSEPIYCGSNINLCTGAGPLIGGKEAKNTSFHHNLMAHNKGRNPMIKTGGLGVTDVVNNIMFVPESIAASVSDEMAKIKANFVGNWVIAPNTDGSLYGVVVLDHNTGGYDLYVKDNLGPYRTDQIQPDNLFVDPNGRSYIRSIPNSAPQITTTSPDTAYQQVLAASGAAHRLNEKGEFVPARDSVDTRIVNDVNAGVTRLIVDMVYPASWPSLNPGTAYTDSDQDGMADTWEISHFGTLQRGSPTNSSADFDKDGYTDLEEFLNGADPKQGGPTSSPTPTLTPTSTGTPAPTPTPTDTATPTSTPTDTPTPTSTGTPTLTPTPTDTPTPVPTDTPSPTPTDTPTATATPVPPNLLTNGSFDFDLNRDGRPDSWTSDSKFTRHTRAMSGSFYAGRHFARNNANYTISQATDVTAGRIYNFSGWVNIPSAADAFTFKLVIHWLNTKGQPIGAMPLKSYSTPTDGWDQTLVTMTAPAGAVMAELQMVVTSLKGRVYVDSFKFYSSSAK